MVPLRRELETRWPDARAVDGHSGRAVVGADTLVDVCRFLTRERGCHLLAVVARQREVGSRAFDLIYVMLDPSGRSLVEIAVDDVVGRAPSITGVVHAADWHEREIEDLFGLRFSGHPVLGDFVLHDATWPEDVAPMRREYDLHAGVELGERRDVWRPRTLLRQPGAHTLPVGPVYGDVAEAVLFILESTGEQVRRCISRPFYKYRAVEKLAEGRTPEAAVLLAERFAGGAAFAHALGLCQAVESLSSSRIPRRAEWLRVVFAELERARSHVAAIAGVCGSTALSVAKAEAQLIEEDLLRLSARLTGHRYLFGVCVPGGTSVDLPAESVELLGGELPALSRRIKSLERGLRFSSSFLDRLEDVGVLRREVASEYGCVGPVGRASGIELDLRESLAYAAYDELDVAVASETEGDGFARLRVLFAEAHAALRLCLDAARRLPPGGAAAQLESAGGEAIGVVEAPAGAAVHWVQVGSDGRLARHYIAPPSLRNLHAFPAAAEGNAYQDFPIILSTFNLSIAEGDR